MYLIHEVLAQTPLEFCAMYAMDKISEESLDFKYMWCKDFRKGIVGLHSTAFLIRES